MCTSAVYVRDNAKPHVCVNSECLALAGPCCARGALPGGESTPAPALLPLASPPPAPAPSATCGGARVGGWRDGAGFAGRRVEGRKVHPPGCQLGSTSRGCNQGTPACGKGCRPGVYGSRRRGVRWQLALLARDSLPRSVCPATLVRKSAVAACCSGAQVLGQLLALGPATSRGRAGSSLTHLSLGCLSGWGCAVALVPLFCLAR